MEDSKKALKTQHRVIQPALKSCLRFNCTIVARRKTFKCQDGQNLGCVAMQQLYQEALDCTSPEELGRAGRNILESVTGSNLIIIGEIDPNGCVHDIASREPGWDWRATEAWAVDGGPADSFDIGELCKRVIQEGKSLLINLPSCDPESVNRSFPAHRLTAFLAVPFTRAGKISGLVGIAKKNGRYDRNDRELLEAFTPLLFHFIHHQQTEQSFHDNQAILHTMIESTPVLLSMKNSEGRYVVLNSKAADAISLAAGIPADEIIGKKDEEIYRSDVIRCENDAERQVMTSGEALVLTRTVSVDDESRTYTSTICPCRDYAGNPNGVVTASRDITDFKRAEDALREVNQQKDEFLAVLSHELRNPLAAIRNSLAILDRTVPDGAQTERAKEVMKRQIGQLSRLVDDLLDISRITQQKIQLQPRPLELNELVSRSAEDHRSLFEKKGVVLTVIPVPEKMMVNGDETRLAQVVGNLLQNAVKFTSPGDCVQLSLAKEAVLHQGMIRVTDTGVGIAPEMLPHLFRPFSQADTSLERSRGGLGLGLALSKGLIELHGGNISVHSDGLGKGAEFVIRLPLDETNHDMIIPTTWPGKAPHRNRRVLIIDDNLDLARSLYELLELCEHEVAVAYDGFEGLSKARCFMPDIVLCDIGLPGMSGYDVAKAFQADQTLQGVVMVALTGYAQPTDQIRAVEAGFTKHLAKPVDLDALERLLAELP